MDEYRLSSAPLIIENITHEEEEDRALPSDMATAVTPSNIGVEVVAEPGSSEIAPQDSLTGVKSCLKSQTSTQSSTQSPAKVNAVTLRVYTLKDEESHEMRFESGRLTTTKQVLERMMEVMGIPKEQEEESSDINVEPNQPPFSLWLTSKFLQLQLKSYHLPCKLFKRWRDLLSQYTTAPFEAICSDEPILSFQRNAFFSLKEERKLLKKQDPKDTQNHRKSIDLLYHEAVFNTTKSRYPLSTEDIHTLAGLQAAIKYTEMGKTQPSSSELQADISTFYPSHMHPTSKSSNKIAKLFKQKSVEHKTLQDSFSSSFESAMKKCRDPHQLKVLYLQLCWHKPYYASVFFKGTIEKPFQAINLITTSEQQVVVAINTECLHLLSASAPSDVLLYLTYDQLSWEFQPARAEGEDFFSSLLLEFDSVISSENQRVSKRIEIFSRQAPMMDAMIARCVQCIDKVEEKLRQQRLKEGNDEYLEYSIKTHGNGDSPRIQKQELNYKEAKLQCKVLNPDGETMGSSLTRALRKKRKSKDELSGYAFDTKNERLVPSGEAEARELENIASGEENMTPDIGE